MKKLKINKEIYSEKAIKQTVDAYSSYAKINVLSYGNYAVISFRKCRLDEEQTVKEFENYMIGAENS